MWSWSSFRAFEAPPAATAATSACSAGAGGTWIARPGQSSALWLRTVFFFFSHFLPTVVDQRGKTEESFEWQCKPPSPHLKFVKCYERFWNDQDVTELLRVPEAARGKLRLRAGLNRSSSASTLCDLLFPSATRRCFEGISNVQLAGEGPLHSFSQEEGKHYFRSEARFQKRNILPYPMISFDYTCVSSRSDTARLMC